MWAKSVLLLCIGFQLGKCMELPGCKNGYLDLRADQQVDITCSGVTKKMEWRFSFDDDPSRLLASFVDGIISVNTDLNKTFVFSGVEGNQTLSFNTANYIKRNGFFLNDSLVCQSTTTGDSHPRSARCELNYVYPSQGVMCTAVAKLWDVHVTCNITRAYSSRRHYTCQLQLEKRNPPGKPLIYLEKVTMETKSTSEIVSKGEVTVSGYCSMKTTLPAENGEYAFWVLVSPGGTDYAVNTSSELIVDQPSAPNVTCFPKSNLTKNSVVTCTCQTAGLGQPAGSLTWMVDDKSEGKVGMPDKGAVDMPHQLSFTRNFTLDRGGETEFRCDVTWGNKSIKGQHDKCNAETSQVPTTISEVTCGANVVLNTKSREVVAGGIVTVGVVIILGLW